jgi:hypothetical protein
MRITLGGLASLLLCACVAWAAVAAQPHQVHHYVYFNVDRQRISEPTFLNTRAFEGAQLKYTWKELEPEKDKYDFSNLQKDLDFLTSKGKRLFIQLQDASFDVARINVPRYLLEDKQYNGGAAKQLDDAGTAPIGWVSRRWDPAVQARMQKLFAALGQRFDGAIEGINLGETAIGFGESGKQYPSGFTPEQYKNGTLANMKALKRAFPKSTCIQYANFMPGEFLPWTDHSYLRSVYQCAREAGIGVGGPDLLPYKKGQMNNAYKFIKEIHGAVPVGIAVQDGNYAHVNPNTKKQVTIADLLDFARNYLEADYIFWCTQEPYYSRDVLPFFGAMGKGGSDKPAPVPDRG